MYAPQACLLADDLLADDLLADDLLADDLLADGLLTDLTEFLIRGWRIDRSLAQIQKVLAVYIAQKSAVAEAVKLLIAMLILIMLDSVSLMSGL